MPETDFSLGAQVRSWLVQLDDPELQSLHRRTEQAPLAQGHTGVRRLASRRVLFYCIVANVGHLGLI